MARRTFRRAHRAAAARRNTREGALSIAPYEVIAFMESIV
jgi:hypothetical protein